MSYHGWALNEGRALAPLLRVQLARVARGDGTSVALGYPQRLAG